MSYVRKVLSSDEKLIVITRLHWIYVVEALLIFAAFFAVGLVADFYLYKYTGRTYINMHFSMGWLKIGEVERPFKWLFGAGGLATALPFLMSYISTEIGLTDKRIIYKKGLFFVEVQQLDLEDIRAENVSHGLFGWLFRYGKLHFDCRFIDDLYLPVISKPYQLVKAAHVARMRNPLSRYEEEELMVNLEAIEQARYRSRERLRNLADKVKASFRSRAEK